MEAMPTYRDEAIVLRTHKLGEADRIITLFTRGRGKIRAVAKGVRRTSSKFGGRLEPFSRVDLQLYQGRTLDVVTQAVQLDFWGAELASDYDQFTCAEVMVEAADRLVPVEQEPAEHQYRLLQGALRTLARGTPDGPRPPAMVLGSYLMRAQSLAGYEPALAQCAGCGAALDQPGQLRWFSAPEGGLVCRTCRPVGSASCSSPVQELLMALMQGDWVSTRTVPRPVMLQAAGMVTDFTRWHMDAGLRSLQHAMLADDPV